MKISKIIASVLLGFTLASVAGCHRSEDAFDDRPLEKRPHVETVKPVDKSDPFRP